MARFNEILTGRYNRFLQKLMQMKGGPPSAQLATEIAPNFEIEQLPVELRVLMSFDRYYGGMFVTGVAAQDAAWQATNPVGSGAIVVIESLILSVGATNSVVNVSVTDGAQAPLTNGSAPTRVDSRSNPRSPLVMSTQNNLGADLPIGVCFFLIAAFGVVPIIGGTSNQEIVLSPGRTIRIRNTTVNVSTALWMIYRQRPLEESETLVT